jgi:transcriptional regulator with XRE-family HTH domain
MSRLKRHELHAEARRQNQEQLARLGAEVRASRVRRRLRQVDLAERVGVTQPTISQLERGDGGSLSLDVWQRASIALGRPFRLELARDAVEEPSDAGHLRIQELVLRLARRAGYAGRFELATRPADPSRSADVGLRSDARRLLVLVEAWNTIGDLGAAARATDRKLSEAEAFAVAIGQGEEWRVRGCWVVRATRRNRALLDRYPETFATRFPGSSLGWVRALSEGREPPAAPGLVWCDPGCTRVTAWRRRSAGGHGTIRG